MRSHDKRHVIDNYRCGLSADATARRLHLPTDEVRAIYRKQKR